jgi:hypothetical protein
VQPLQLAQRLARDVRQNVPGQVEHLQNVLEFGNIVFRDPCCYF